MVRAMGNGVVAILMLGHRNSAYARSMALFARRSTNIQDVTARS